MSQNSDGELVIGALSLLAGAAVILWQWYMYGPPF